MPDDERREKRDAETAQGGFTKKTQVVRRERAVDVHDAATDRPCRLRKLAARETRDSAVGAKVFHRAGSAVLREVLGRRDCDHLVTAHDARDEAWLNLWRGAERVGVALAEKIDDAGGGIRRHRRPR